MMIYSMSGFGEASVISEKFNCQVTVRGYNSRNLDIKLKMPGQFNFHEEETIKDKIAQKISRGRIDLAIEAGVSQKQVYMPTDAVIKEFKHTIENLERSLDKKIDIRLSDIITFQNFTRPEADETVKTEQFKNMLPVIDDALTKFIASKNIEGEKLATVIEDYAATILTMVLEIEPLLPLSVEKSVERLKTNIEKLTDKLAMDDPTVLREIAVIADKLDISEETERLKIHLQKVTMLFKNGGQIGKELDYICQEMAREANTIGSKTNLSEIKNHSIKIKTFVEKIREQSMNLE